MSKSDKKKRVVAWPHFRQSSCHFNVNLQLKGPLQCYLSQVIMISKFIYSSTSCCVARIIFKKTKDYEKVLIVEFKLNSSAELPTAGNNVSWIKHDKELWQSIVFMCWWLPYPCHILVMWTVHRLCPLKYIYLYLLLHPACEFIFHKMNRVSLISLFKVLLAYH